MQIDAWQFLAGLMLFLLAMALVEESVHVLAGRRFKTLIAANTSSPLRGIFSGTVATAVLQSSSVVSLMMLAFVGARVIPMRRALLVVFGANLGTTATGWIVATIGFKLDLEAMALPLIAVGGLIQLLMSKRQAAQTGRLVLGIGLLLLALTFMKESVDSVTQLVDPQVLANFSAVEFLLFGTVFSAVVQSSSAAMVITLSLLDAGVIDLGSAAALVIGADLGTTSTVLLGAIGGTPNKKRLAMGHFLFNLVTDLVAFVIRVPLLWLAGFMADPLLTLVAFHSLFNLLGLLLWVPLIGYFADFLESRFAASHNVESLYLEDTAGAVPEAALSALQRESGHLLSRVVEHNAMVFAPVPAAVDADVFTEAYEKARRLEGEMVSYALDLPRAELSETENERISALLHAARDAQVAGKLVKDVVTDYLRVAREDPQLFVGLTDAQRSLYQRLARLADELERVTADELEELALAVEASHQQCHEAIYDAIKTDGLDEARISSVLNVNRNFFNSNRAMLACLGELVQVEAAAAA